MFKIVRSRLSHTHRINISPLAPMSYRGHTTLPGYRFIQGYFNDKETSVTVHSLEEAEKHFDDEAYYHSDILYGCYDGGDKLTMLSHNEAIFEVANNMLYTP